MPKYRVSFINDWITGRWGFTDRVFHDLKGREADPTHSENAWVVNFTGSAEALGRILTKHLNIQAMDFERFGSIFEITRELDPGEEPVKPTPQELNPRKRPQYGPPGR